MQANETILRLRHFEKKCGQIYGMGLIRGFSHQQIVQEGVITGREMVELWNDNTIYSGYAHII